MLSERIEGTTKAGEPNVREDLPVSHCSRSDVGIKRSHNQDAWDTQIAASKEVWRARGHLFVVADGMGAHAVGEKASGMAVKNIKLSYLKARGINVDESLRRAIVEANADIYKAGKLNKEFEGMGTTATALVLGPMGAWVGHVGDSRCYRIRGETIEQLTFDHSLLWEFARKNNLSPEDVTSVPKNIIVRSLGPEPNVNVDVNGPYKVKDGDRFLLCTDGLSGQVSEREIWSIVSYLPADEACEFLVDLSNYRGGIDNVTLILVQAGDPAHPVRQHWSFSRFLRRVGSWIYQKVPARYGLLMGGAALCGVAAALKSYQIPGSVYAAIPGAALLLAALGWFGYISYRRRKFGNPPPPAPPPVYRSQTFHLEQGLVEKLAKNQAFLREIAHENHWKVDLTQLDYHRELAERAYGAGDMPESFREYSRSLAILFAGMRQARNKQEIFEPNFQKETF